MRRLRRILLNAATVLSLVLCLFTAIFWITGKVRSHWWIDRVVTQHGAVVREQWETRGWNAHGFGYWRWGIQTTYGPKAEPVPSPTDPPDPRDLELAARCASWQRPPPAPIPA